MANKTQKEALEEYAEDLREELRGQMGKDAADKLMEEEGLN